METLFPALIIFTGAVVLLVVGTICALVYVNDYIERNRSKL
jgi:hypothetical protein